MSTPKEVLVDRIMREDEDTSLRPTDTRNRIRSDHSTRSSYRGLEENVGAQQSDRQSSSGSEHGSSVSSLNSLSTSRSKADPGNP
jgi:hypothetical protein